MTPREIIARHLCTMGAQGCSGISAFERAAYRTTAAGMVQAITSAGYRIEPDWQPIETAPKDGTIVLLFTRWAGDEIHPEPFDEIQIGCWDEGNLTGDIWHREAEWSVDKIGTATHWRPLPAPPTIRALAKEKQG